MSSEQIAELEDIDNQVRYERLFGITDLEAQRTVRRGRAMRKRQDAVGYAPHLWPEAEPKWGHETERGYVEAPTLFTTEAVAQEERRALEQRIPEAYLELVERYGEADTNEAFDNSSPLRVMWADREFLLDSLEDSDLLYLMVDGVLKLRQDLIEELREQAAQG